jgi:hypothetical protein
LSNCKTYSRYPWTDPRVEVGPSPINGVGMIAREPIREGEVVVIWGGVLFNRAEIEAGRARGHSIVDVADGVYLGGPIEEPLTTDDYMNHSCDPNLWLIDEVTLAARRDIAAGEELTADYSTWGGDPDWALPVACSCGSPLCRKTITGNDWMLESLQRRYEGHFSPYLNERIRKLKGL